MNVFNAAGIKESTTNDKPSDEPSDTHSDKHSDTQGEKPTQEGKKLDADLPMKQSKYTLLVFKDTGHYW